MTIDPKEIDTIEKSMVHDVDEEPKPKGWGIYLTLRFLSKVVLGVYGVMLLGCRPCRWSCDEEIRCRFHYSRSRHWCLSRLLW